MRNKWFIGLLFFSIVQFSFAQLKVSDKREIRKQLFKKINTLRKSKGVPALILHPDLEKAAQLHADYMQKNSDLTHEQRVDSLRTPKKRIAQFSEKFNVFGENILYTKPTKTPIKKGLLKRIAHEMFIAWKNSPRHYANMISDNYTHGDFGFTYDKRTKRIYAAHVFGGIGVTIEGQLSENAFNIQAPEDNEAVDCFDLMGRKQNIAINLGNAVSIEGKDILLYYHDKCIVADLIENEDDGIAIDILLKSQFACGKKNQLDVSKIYDGVLLKPVYKKELFGNNQSKSAYRLITKIGELPDEFIGKELQISMLLIKSGVKCDYNYPISISRSDYELVAYPPNIQTETIDFVTEGIVGMEDVYFNFDRDEINATNAPELLASTGIHSMDIKSYSSVEGNETANKALHKARAAYIKKYMLFKIENKDIPITSDAKENWELCKIQLEMFGLESLLDKEKQVIRSYINKNSTSEWKEALAKQRVSKARIFYTGKVANSDELFLEMNLLTGLKSKNYKLVNKTLYELYKADKQVSFFYESEWFSEFLEAPELVTNTSAMLLKDVKFYNTEMIVVYVRNWLKKASKLSKEATENLLNLYAITTDKLLSYWDVEAEKIARIMHPDKTVLLLENYDSSQETHPLLLNFHIATINYYSHVRDTKKLIYAFQFITKYYKGKALTIEDEVKLALFFNHWSSFQESYDLLVQSFHKKTINKEGVFILAEVAMLAETDQKIIKSIMQKAYEQDPKRWCAMIENDFQLLRNKNIKNNYCKKCSK
ncbi:CAP domain-containing protein [Kordia jejudonensis]|uniref:CAP domain-containing protein n=1 Tax=Kordia jejudonensis TaxID=1348245 RepID=UPI00062901C3|nr:CAP domain-containing protein [Kordia jejudonensis]